MNMKKIIYSIIAIILLLVGKVLMKGDYPAFLQWWATAAILGIIFLPVTTLLFPRFHDRGYLFSKAIGVAVTGYLMWLFSSLRLMKFTPLSCMLCVAISLLLNVGILLWKKRAGDAVYPRGQYPQRGVVDAAIAEELMFFGIFLLFTYIRCFKPEAYGTEKFMDFGFMTSMLRSDYMPPQDFWFSGTKLNYYYVGQYIAAYLTKLSQVKVSDSYNLMLMMVGAFTAVLPYSLVYNVVLHFMSRRVENGKKSSENDKEFSGNMKEFPRKFRILPALSGILAGAGVCIAGNMHFPAYRWFEPVVKKFFGMEVSGENGWFPGTYWFPDATRFIGYHPETSDKTIHEFPAYSFVLGDLHAHVINILFVLTVLGLLYSWLMQREEIGESKPSVWKEIFHPVMLMLYFFIGLFHMTNFWDFPIYYVVSGGVILFSNLVVYNFKGKALWLTGLQGVLVFALSYLVSLPFTINFDQISTRPCLTVARTPLNQLIILWGLPISRIFASSSV
jgi:YYY domain-containing protein